MPTLHVFVDTNVLLSFYAYATDDIEQLKKLSDLIRSNTLNVYVSSQVAEEFRRNREVKLAVSIAEFSQNGSKSLPRFLADYEEAEAYKAALKELSKVKNSLVQKAMEDAASVSFAVDKLVNGLFFDAGVGDVTPAMIDKARLRRDVGNPPGKTNSLGDQINWEFLLATVPDEVTLHVVSKDGDFQSAFKDGNAHRFLIDEWKVRKKGNLCLHKEIKPFLNAQFDNIKLEVDREKAAAVRQLAYSGAFSVTHLAITQLEPFFDALTADDARELLEAGIDNSQIKWIGSDGDVSSFYCKLLAAFGEQVDAELLAAAKAVFEPKAVNDEDEIPF
jgi:predicted nucleic acid-binding protein